MKYFSHEKLHKLMDVQKNLKERSDKIHSMPPSDSIDDWRKQKLELMKIYAEAVGCKRLNMALKFVNETIGYIKQQTHSVNQWKDPILVSKHRKKFSPSFHALREKYQKSKMCHSSNGNDYICYCDE